MPDESHFDGLLEGIDKREKKQARATSLFVLISVALAVGLLLVTANQVKVATEEVAQLKTAKETLDRQVAAARTELGNLEERVASAMVAASRAVSEKEQAEARLESMRYVDRARHKIDMLDIKGGNKYNSPQAMKVYREIARAQSAKIDWAVGKQGPGTGYNSPNFAAYVLKKSGQAKVPADTNAYRYFLSRPDVKRPKPGDLILYETGYSLFYFIDAEKRPFVYGMTPLGIASLKYNFTKPQRVVRLFKSTKPMGSTGGG